MQTANNIIDKNWKALIKPNKLEITSNEDKPSAQHNEEQQENLDTRDLPTNGLQIVKRAGPPQSPHAAPRAVEEAEAGGPKLHKRVDACREELVVLAVGLKRRTGLVLIAHPLASAGAGVAGAGASAGAGVAVGVLLGLASRRLLDAWEGERRLLQLWLLRWWAHVGWVKALRSLRARDRVGQRGGKHRHLATYIVCRCDIHVLESRSTV